MEFIGDEWNIPDLDSQGKLIKSLWETELISKNYKKGFRGLCYVEKQIFIPGIRWIDQDITGKTLLVTVDQGRGDTILFSRFLLPPWREKLDCEIIFDCQISLQSVYEGHISNITDRTRPEPKFDYAIPISGLPHLLGITEEHELIKKPQYIDGPIKEKINPNDDFKVGIVWKGTNHTNTDLTLYDFERNFGNIKGCSLYSLQYPNNYKTIVKSAILDIRKDLDNAKMKSEFMLGHKIKDFSDVVSFIKQMDLIISVDTATAHLAGAMNKPVWIPLKYGHVYWPWYSKVYSSAETFWQQRNKSWFYVFEKMRNKLIDRLNA